MIQTVFFGSSLAFLGQICAAGTAVILARNIDSVIFGRYLLLIAMVNLCAVILGGGISKLLLRERALAQNNVYLTRWLKHTLIAAILFSVLIFAAYASLKNIAVDLIFLCGITIALKFFLYVQAAELNARDKVVESKAVFSFLPGFFLVIFLTISWILEYLYLDVLIACYCAAALCSCALGQLILKRAGASASPSKNVMDSKKYKPYLNSSLVSFVLLSAVVGFNQEMVPILFSFLGIDENQIAYFKVATQVVVVSFMIVLVMQAILAPRISILYSSEKYTELRLLIRSYVKISTIVFVTIFVFWIVFGEMFIEIVFGQEYSAASSDILRVLLLSKLIAIVCGPVGLVLNMIGEEKTTLKASSVAIILNILLIIILAEYQALSAAYAAFIVSLYWNLYLLAKLKKKLGYRVSLI